MLERWWQNCVKSSVNRISREMERHLERNWLRGPPHLPPTTIYNLAIRQLTPVHDKWELTVPQLQFSLYGGPPLLGEHRCYTGSSQNSGHWSSLSSTVYPWTLTVHAQNPGQSLKRPKPLVGIDLVAALSLRLIELCCIEAQHTYTNRFLIRPLI